MAAGRSSHRHRVLTPRFGRHARASMADVRTRGARARTRAAGDAAERMLATRAAFMSLTLRAARTTPYRVLCGARVSQIHFLEKG